MCIQVLLAGSLVLGARITVALPRPCPADQSKRVRILHFPRDRVVGTLVLYELSRGAPLRFGMYGDDLGQRRVSLDARGDVVVPEGMVVALYVWPQNWRALRWLASLSPDDLDVLSVSYPDPGSSPPTFGDSIMSYIARLTGLKCLDLQHARVTDRGLSYLRSLVVLEKLTLPPGTTDAGLAEVARLPRLKVLWVLGDEVTDKGVATLAHVTSLEELSLSGQKMTDACLAHLADLPRLRLLRLWGHGFTDAGIVHLQHISSLTSLDLSGMDLTDAGAARLAAMVQIEELNLFNTLLTDRGLAQLASLCSLKKLTLEGMGTNRVRITDEGLVHIGKMTSLEHLYLPCRNNSITDRGLGHLVGLSRLKCLRAGGSSKSTLSDAALEYIGRLPALEVLLVGGRGITDRGLASLARLTTLRELNLFTVGRVTDDGLAYLAQLKQLRKFSVRGGRFTVSGLKQLDALPHLVELNVAGVHPDGAALDLNGLTALEMLSIGGDLTDRDLVTLSRLRRLRRLSLRGRFTGEGISRLAQLPELATLSLVGPEILDDVLAALVKCKRLWHLNIRGSFTDQGLIRLGDCPALRVLMIESDRPFSKQALAGLRQTNPRLRVLTNSRKVPPGHRGRRPGGHRSQ